MLRNFVIQYIDDVTKKVITKSVTESVQVDATIKLADLLGYAPIILSIKEQRNSEPKGQPVRE